MTILQEMGYRPEIDDDGDVHLRYQMKDVYFLNREEEDENYIIAMLPQFTGIEEGDEMVTLGVCNKLTRDVKFVKVLVDQTLSSVTANCEFYATDEESLRLNINRALTILGTIRSLFHQVKNEMTES